ncbi:2-oxoadipate dioxygenase/decarboxylase family protein [Rickettsiella endosymbiont of Aleochara curtula]|uniref:2-oxoadipate dioxygenase/decarboxylase family protein n=1 Tax=Rickettsiella endosymbiont of Aleochara curtula TaxID=3077936 RepID=UPI00313DFE4A
MINRVKNIVFSQLWENYSSHLTELTTIQSYIQKHFQEELILDHFAIIDLPGPFTGMDTLSCLFSYLGYRIRGQDYLAEKQNNFRWLSEEVSPETLATEVSPQIVVADFRREALAPQVLKIIDRYAGFAQALDHEQLKLLHQRTLQQDEQAAKQLAKFILNYLQSRDWPLPTLQEYAIVKNQNELLAWVLVMGRQVNHFAWGIHLSKSFAQLKEFNQFLSSTLNIPLNQKGGLIKGNINKGIEQSATQPTLKSIKLADGVIDLSDRFIEFVWRYPKTEKAEEKIRWHDYFTGFVADNADRVVESLYLK